MYPLLVTCPRRDSMDVVTCSWRRKCVVGVESASSFVYSVLPKGFVFVGGAIVGID